MNNTKKYNLKTEIYSENIGINIKRLFQYIVAEVWSAGGDGDCTVICKRYDAKQLGKLFYSFIQQEYPQTCYDIDVSESEYNGVIISDRCNETWFFTNDINYNPADWEQCIIRI